MWYFANPFLRYIHLKTVENIFKAALVVVYAFFGMMPVTDRIIASIKRI